MADEITRKQFLQAGAVTLIAASLGACASDDGESDDGADSGGDDGGDCTGGATANIATNHGHSMMVAAGDITAGAAMDYEIMGTATHSHTVSLSAADMEMLAAGESVSVTSSSDGGHTHAVTVTC